MKKFLLFSVLAFLSMQSFALVTQGSWRWRNDDGNETTATYMAEQNTAVTISSSSNVIRLRIGLYNTQTLASDVATSVLQYATSASGPWDTISTAAGTKAFVLAGTDPNVTDGEATTSQLTMAYPFFPGKMVVSSTELTHNEIPVGSATEYEWVFKPTENMKPSTTYYFRVDPVSGYPEALPSFTTAAVLPVQFAYFTVENEGGRARLNWKTATEQNADYFAVERSSNGKDNWQTLSKVQAKGNSSQGTLYSAYDNQPLTGSNFYRLKQMDLDGKYLISETRVLVMNPALLLQVYPNPSKGPLFFKRPGYNGNAQLQVTDMNGRTVLTQTVQLDGSNRSYSFELKNKPLKGLYVVTLKGTGLNEKTKIVIE